MTPEGFREVMGFLISFIQKDKQTEAMVEKLCLRFDNSDAVQSHRDIAFCLGALTHTERSVRKLAELSKTYLSKLGDDEVLASFQALAQKSRKFARPEFKASIDALDALLMGSKEAGSEDGAVAGAQPTADAEATTANRATLAAEPKKARNAEKKKSKSRAAKKPWEGGDDSSADEDNDENSAAPPKAKEVPLPPTKARQVRGSRAKAK